MSASVGVPRIVAPLLLFFRRIVRGYFRRSFHAVRVRGAQRFAGASGPLIVYANHGSWWDPMVAFYLADKLMPRRRHYAPMDASALERYGLLRALGVFGVAMDSARGAVRFLRTGEAVLASGGVLWITPQGRFVDARARPLEFKPGLAALATRVGCTVLPLAIEYTFWDERTPECLLQFGEPLRVAAGQPLDGVLEAALLTAMEELREAAIARDPRAFQTLSDGTAGAGGFYALGQRIKAFAQRRKYRAEHTAPHTAVDR
jgi:1-acyl-sn-glycerol-3-phosphate acyltransferase